MIRGALLLMAIGVGACGGSRGGGDDDGADGDADGDADARALDAFLEALPGPLCDHFIACGRIEAADRAGCLDDVRDEVSDVGSDCAALLDFFVAHREALEQCLATDQGNCDDDDFSNFCPAAAGLDLDACQAGCTSPAECGDGLTCVNGQCVPATCSYTNDGQCDEPEGTGLCQEGTDVADCSAPDCTPAGSTCESGLDCCPDHTCVTFSPESILCAFNCTSGADCASECCAPLEGAGSVCASPELCGLCVANGEDCSPGDCCPGAECTWVDYVGAICVEQTPCPSDCQVGGVCCRGNYCAGDCVGSPCCN